MNETPKYGNSPNKNVNDNHSKEVVRFLRRLQKKKAQQTLNSPNLIPHYQTAQLTHQIKFFNAYLPPQIQTLKSQIIKKKNPSN